MKYLSSYPKLVKELHPTKNGDLTPENITHGSHKKLWWLCSKGHIYYSIISNRTRKNGSGCPECSGNKVGKDNSLGILFPEIASEWHPSKNAELTPKDFTHGSKSKVWWLCPEGHSYVSTINQRTSLNKTGCSYCAGKKINHSNNLEILFPEIANEWHPKKNKDLTPSEVTHGTSKKVWWLCTKGHSYASTVNQRTSMNSKCPYCLGRRVSEDNNLLILFPEIAKEWHPSKNRELTPKDFTQGSKSKVWWLCSKGHSYKSVIKNRTGSNQNSCPHCSNQSSEPEIRILSELQWFFNEVKHRYKLKGVEIDVFLPNIGIAIEYDGNYWHKGKTVKDLEKNKFLLSHNIKLIRVREYPLELTSENDVLVRTRILAKKDLDGILKKIVPFVDINIKEKINSYLSHSSFVNDEFFKKYRSYFPSPFPEKSLLKTHPLIAKEWDYEKNYPLKPENFSHGSVNKSWWLCPKGHSYDATINNKTGKKPTGCPYCSGKKTLNLDLFK